jgi:hypothetical protein
MVAAVAIGANLPRPDDTSGLVLIVPSLLLGFVVLSVLAPLSAGGGVELYPAEQLVAYPVRPRTIYWGSLLLAPLNLAWLLQVLVTLGLLTFIASRSVGAQSATTLTMLVFLGLATLAGHAAAWAIVGVRRTRRGRWVTWGLAAAATFAFLILIRTDRLTDVLDDSPTVWVVVGALAAGGDNWDVWAVRTLVLVALLPLAILAGLRVSRWALLRPSDASGTPSDRIYPRSANLDAPWGTLLRLDLLGVWRSAPLRRGALLIALLPGAVLALTRTDWAVLTLVPGLVCAGAALLFCVNAFCLDAGGAVWLSSLPASARLVFAVRSVTVAIVVLLPLVVAVAAGISRAPAPPSAAWVVAVACAAIACWARVTATCMRWSVRRPHKAELLGPRDTPAPPGAMATYALRLSATSTGIGLTMTILAVIGDPLLPVFACAVVVLLAMRSLVSSLSLYETFEGRAKVVATVSGG